MNKLTRITDLEQFVHQHIKMPYQNQGVADIDKLTLENFEFYIAQYPLWWGLVANRIMKIGFYFPYYIKHNLVDIIVAL